MQKDLATETDWTILISIVPTLITILFVLLGWRVLFNNAKRIASRSEIYYFQQRINSLLYDIEELSESFWVKNELITTPSYYELLVLNKVNRLNNIISLIKKRGILFTYSQFKLRKSCTFHSHKITKLTDSEKRENLQEIHTQINSIEESLSEAILSEYPHSK